jgi:hypothetical protein
VHQLSDGCIEDCSQQESLVTIHHVAGPVPLGPGSTHNGSGIAPLVATWRMCLGAALSTRMKAGILLALTLLAWTVARATVAEVSTAAELLASTTVGCSTLGSQITLI